MPSLTFVGNLNLQLSDGARPQPVPLSFEITYTKKLLHDFSFAAAQTNLAVPQGTVTSPRVIYVEVTSGEVSISRVIAGTAPTTLIANATPPPDMKPFLLQFSYEGIPEQLYITTPGAASGKIWLFE